ncbi:Uncharacterised protein [Shigella flexneri]|nr:Uncharacterised protein [Shigella flexneri]
MTVFGKHTQGSAGVILCFTGFAERRRQQAGKGMFRVFQQPGAGVFA